MESIDFLHADRIFTIFFQEDLSFKDLRAVLDHLLDRDAFKPHVQEEEGLYAVHLPHASFTVWVANMDVYIQPA